MKGVHIQKKADSSDRQTCSFLFSQAYYLVNFLTDGSRLLSFFCICQEERTNELIEIVISMIKSTLGLL